MNIKLKPCPFCGGEAKLWRTFETKDITVICNHKEDCPLDGASLPLYHGEEQAANEWNRRAEPDNPSQPPSKSVCQGAPDKIIRGLLDLARYSEQESKDYVDADDPDDPFLRDAAVLREAARLLKQMQANMDNPPLTLEKLREMDGKPVYVKFMDTQRIHKAVVIVDEDTSGVRVSDKLGRSAYPPQYGKTWLAYRRKPEEVTT